MKWFKHFSDALDDTFIDFLLDEFGPAGYLVWFGTLELIAKENGTNLTGKASFRKAHIARKFRVSWTTVERVFNACSTHGKLSFSQDSSGVNIDCPKLLQFKDNWAKRSVVTTEKLQSNPPTNTEAEADEEEYNTILARNPEVSREKEKSSLREKYPDWFEPFWNSWPTNERKRDKKLCFEICQRKKLQGAMGDVIAGVESWKQSREWKEGYVPEPAKFLRRERWREMPQNYSGVNMVEVKRINDELRAKGIL